ASSGPPSARPSSISVSASGRGAHTVHPLASQRTTGERATPSSKTSQPGAVPATSSSPGASCQTDRRVRPQKSSASTHSPPCSACSGTGGSPRNGSTGAGAGSSGTATTGWAADAAAGSGTGSGRSGSGNSGSGSSASGSSGSGNSGSGSAGPGHS